MPDTIYPTTAYDLLTTEERDAVDKYVEYIIGVQRSEHEPISRGALKPIPQEWVLKTHNVLNKPIVRAAVAERLKDESDREDTSPQKVIKEFITIGTSDIGEFIETDAFGNVCVKPLDKIDPIKRRAIKSVETKASQFGMSSKVVLHDKLPALRALSDMMGLTPSEGGGYATLTTPARSAQIIEEEQEAPEVAYQRLLEATA